MIVVWCFAMAVVSAGCQSGSTGPTPSGTATPASAAATPNGLAEWFDVGGHKLYLSCSGTGSPTIVFESGLGGSSSTWSFIADSFPPSVRTCIYSRLNLSPSDEAPVTAWHTGADSVRDLHTLLDVAAVPGPYLLVGHSFGGLLAVMYAGTYPADVVGLVLLDPTLPAEDELLKLLTEAERATFAAQAATNDERVDFFETLEQAKLLVPKVPNIPILFLGTTHHQALPGWSVEKAKKRDLAVREAEQRFVDALPQADLRRVDTGHDIPLEAPQLVIDEVQRVLDKTR